MSRKYGAGGLLSAVTSCISMTMVLILLGTVVATVMLAFNFTHTVRENFTVELLLDDSISTRDLTALRGNLQRKPYTRTVNYISKEQGTRELMADLGGTPDEMLGSSPVPAEYEVFLKADYANADSLRRYMPALTKLRGVKEVVYPQNLLTAMDRTIGTVSLVLLVVAGLLAFVSFSLINNTVRMAVYAHRYAIHTMKLVGAKWSFIRRPFLVEATWLGLISAGVASGVLYAGLQMLVRLNGNAEFQIVTPQLMGIVVGSIFAAGLLLTLFCTLVSVNRHLHYSRHEVFTK